jgi:hypothetical protein
MLALNHSPHREERYTPFWWREADASQTLINRLSNRPGSHKRQPKDTEPTMRGRPPGQIDIDVTFCSKPLLQEEF